MIGIIKKIDALEVAKVAFKIGCGRKTKESKIDYFSGIELLKKENDEIKAGDKLFRIYIGDYIRKNISKDALNMLIHDSVRTLTGAYTIDMLVLPEKEKSIKKAKK